MAPTTPTTSMSAPSAATMRSTRPTRSPMVSPSLAFRTRSMMVTTATPAGRTEMMREVVLSMMVVAVSVLVSVLVSARICVHSMLGPRCDILEVVTPRAE